MILQHIVCDLKGPIILLFTRFNYKSQVSPECVCVTMTSESAWDNPEGTPTQTINTHLQTTFPIILCPD